MFEPMNKMTCFCLFFSPAASLVLLCFGLRCLCNSKFSVSYWVLKPLIRCVSQFFGSCRTSAFAELGGDNLSAALTLYLHQNNNRWLLTVILPSCSAHRQRQDLLAGALPTQIHKDGGSAWPEHRVPGICVTFLHRVNKKEGCQQRRLGTERTC